MREEIRKFLARHRRNRLVGKVGRALGYFWQGYENQDYDVATNGERFVLETVARHSATPVVLDVGAHTGEWAGMAAAAWPGAAIHSFEVIPATFEKLRAACAAWPQVTPHRLGLGEHAGALEFCVARGRDELTSAVAGVHGDLHRFEFDRVTAEVLPGDVFCARQGLEHVGFLKIDVEGMEPQVIRGFAGMLRAGRIDALQFEYGQVNLRARFFLGDFHALLGEYGLRVGKIYPNYVDFREYHFTQDMLLGPNFLAVPAANKALLAALQG